MLEDRLSRLRNYYHLQGSIGVGWTWLPFLRRWLKRKAKRETTRNLILLKGGVLVEAEASDPATRRVWTSGRLAPDLAWAIHRYVKPASAAVDVGANLGYVSLLLADRVGPQGQVIAIEPNPHLLEKLRRLAWLNGLENLEVHACACSDRAGRAGFSINPRDHTQSRLAAESGLEVQTLPLDQILAGVQRSVSFIKIDVEGHEAEVLEGARGTVEKHRPAIVFEIGSHHPEQVSRIREFFSSLHYEVVGVLTEWGVEVKELSPKMGERSFCNYLSLPLRSSRST